MEWKYTENETPRGWETGVWDGKRSDFVIAQNKSGETVIARIYEGFLDGSEFRNWYSSEDYELNNIIRWMPIPE